MKKIYSFFLVVALIAGTKPAYSQCTASQMNWDYLDFLPSAVTKYTLFYPTATFAYTQYFAMGTRRATFTMSPPANITLDGENATNTADAGSNATPGDDVQFTTTNAAATTIAISLDSNVTNLNFSLFDLDNNQSATITATNLAGIPQNIIVTKANAASGIVIFGSGFPFVVATGPGANYANNDNNGTINVNIAGPVKNINITLGNAVGDVWLSDINACVTGAFVNDWRNISRPFTGMPSYIITVVNKRIVMLDPATGNAKDIYTDPTAFTNNLNGLCYDPVNRIIYYAYSLTASPGTSKSIYKYDINSEIKSTFIANVNTTSYPIPTYSVGLESGAATFYNSALYYGVEGTHVDSSGTPKLAYGGREHTVWRMDFDNTNTPYRITQVYSAKTDSLDGSGTFIFKHDWSDIGVTNNGMLYDFDGARGDSAFFHFNMMTGQTAQYASLCTGDRYPKQTAIDWQENVYNMGDTSRTTPSRGFISPYNISTGTVNTAQTKTVTINGVAVTGSWGDCGEAFRPYCDFGDAPASYDPDPWSPAVHERDTAIRIGATFDREWNKTSSVLANADGADEDGLSYIPVLAPGYNFGTHVSVYNNTGGQATLIAWIDKNGNGTFDATETCNAVAAINSMPVMQSIAIFWPAISSSLINGSYTYLRIRLVKGTSMTSSNATGYYDNGETEDYRILVDNYPLAVNLLSFNATKSGSHASKLIWSATEDLNTNVYEIQRSSDARNWGHIGFENSDNTSGTKNYEAMDYQPLAGINYYRLVFTGANGQKTYSEVRSVLFTDFNEQATVLPNPAKDQFYITINNSSATTIVEIKITGMTGNIIYSDSKIANSGNNNYAVAIPSSWPQGIYLVHITKDSETTIKKLLINR